MNKASRGRAREVHQLFISRIPERIGQLTKLLRANGLSLGHDDADIQKFNTWFLQNIEADPSRPGKPTAEWICVCYDIGMFLGEEIIRRAPALHWELNTRGKTMLHYQHSVIAGFPPSPGRKTSSYDVDPCDVVCRYGTGVIQHNDPSLDRGRVSVRGVEVDLNSLPPAPAPDEKLFVKMLHGTIQLMTEFGYDPSQSRA